MNQISYAPTPELFWWTEEQLSSLERDIGANKHLISDTGDVIRSLISYVRHLHRRLELRKQPGGSDDALAAVWKLKEALRDIANLQEKDPEP